MIHEVDEALRRLVERELDSSGVEISFEAPTRDWAARRSAPTRRPLPLRHPRGPRRGATSPASPSTTSTGSSSAGAGRRACSSSPTSSRRGPSAPRTSTACSRPSSPARFATTRSRAISSPGRSAEQPLNMPVTVALPPPEDRAISDVWTALGGELKPSLDLVITAPVDSQAVYEAGKPVLEEPRISVGGEQPNGRRRRRGARDEPEPRAAARGGRRARGDRGADRVARSRCVTRGDRRSLPRLPPRPADGAGATRAQGRRPASGVGRGAATTGSAGCTSARSDVDRLLRGRAESPESPDDETLAFVADVEARAAEAEAAGHGVRLRHVAARVRPRARGRRAAAGRARARPRRPARVAVRLPARRRDAAGARASGSRWSLQACRCPGRPRAPVCRRAPRWSTPGSSRSRRPSGRSSRAACAYPTA